MSFRPLILSALLAALPASAMAQAAHDNIDALIEAQAKAQKIPASFVHKVVKRESNYNPKAKGGSALGLMQIKHATARGLGYKGDAAGLYDPETNLRYGVAYLGGAYRAAKGDLALAYQYYNRGYYYVAKRLGIEADVAETSPAVPAPAPAATSGSSFASLFSLRPGEAQPAAAAAPGQALAYAPQAAAAPTEVVEVPLPPRRPAAFAALQVASLAPAADLSSVSVAPAAASTPAATPAAAAAAPVETGPAAAAGAEAAVPSETVEVPLPPRRPSEHLLAAFGRPVAVARKAPTVLEASALPPAQ